MVYNMIRMRHLIASLQSEEVNQDTTAVADRGRKRGPSQVTEMRSAGFSNNLSAVDIFLDADDDIDDDESTSVSFQSNRSIRTTMSTPSSLQPISQSERNHNKSNLQQCWNFSGWISQNLAPANNSNNSSNKRRYTENKASYAYLMGKSKFEMGLCHEALTWWNKAIIIQRHVYGKDNVITAETLNSIGLALINTEQYFEAMTALEESLHIRKQILGHDHEDTLQTKKNIALLFQTTDASVFPEESDEDGEVGDEDYVTKSTSNADSNNNAKQCKSIQGSALLDGSSRTA